MLLGSVIAGAQGLGENLVEAGAAVIDGARREGEEKQGNTYGCWQWIEVLGCCRSQRTENNTNRPCY